MELVMLVSYETYHLNNKKNSGKRQTKINLRKSLAATALANCTASCTHSNSQTGGNNVNLKPKSLCNVLRMRADIFLLVLLFVYLIVNDLL